jgi:tetraacyldisaccharide-1-P 4'-kinase
MINPSIFLIILSKVHFYFWLPTVSLLAPILSLGNVTVNKKGKTSALMDLNKKGRDR